MSRRTPQTVSTILIAIGLMLALVQPAAAGPVLSTLR